MEKDYNYYFDYHTEIVLINNKEKYRLALEWLLKINERSYGYHGIYEDDGNPEYRRWVLVEPPFEFKGTYTSGYNKSDHPIAKANRAKLRKYCRKIVNE